MKSRYSGFVLAAAGLLFSVWARLHLGSNWSRAVTIKQDHELITSWPYAFVRHPIYTGLLLMFLGSALAEGEWRGLVALALVFAALWRKLKLEERWLGEHFGAASYTVGQRSGTGVALGEPRYVWQIDSAANIVKLPRAMSDRRPGMSARNATSGRRPSMLTMTTRGAAHARDASQEVAASDTAPANATVQTNRLNAVRSAMYMGHSP